MGILGRLWNWVSRGQVDALEELSRRELLFKNVSERPRQD